MSVLGTKLHAPSPRRELVPRPRLLGRLQVERPRKVLVCAPAGFGKTTLLTQRLAGAADANQGKSVEAARAPLAVSWLSLVGRDVDLRRFLTHPS